MTTNEYLKLDDVEYCIFCEARDSLKLSGNLRIRIDRGKCDKEILRKELETYIETMKSRASELQDILDELNAKEESE